MGAKGGRLEKGFKENLQGSVEVWNEKEWNILGFYAPQIKQQGEKLWNQLFASW